MVSASLLSVLLSAAAWLAPVLGSPVAADHQNLERALGLDDDGTLEHVVFKRGDVLTPRELEQARDLGVNLDQMYKHSMIKRADGDDHTIWVDNSWQTRDEIENRHEVERRQQRLHVWESQYHRGWASYQCRADAFFGFIQRAGQKAYTGGVMNAAHWGRNRANEGAFDMKADCCRYFRDIIISGSNSGQNMRFSIQADREQRFLIGSRDIADICDKSVQDFRTRGLRGSWEVAASGLQHCDIHGHNSRIPIHWEIFGTTKRAG